MKDFSKEIEAYALRNAVEFGKADAGKILPKLFQHGLEKGELNLPKALGKVITRMPPEPSKYLHVGHALSFLINHRYAKENEGKCVLRFDDANPEKVSQEYQEAILDDI